MTDPFVESLYSEELYQPFPKTSIVIGIPWEKVSEEERQLLAKILGAIKLNLDSVRVVEQSQFNLSSWVEKPETVLCFSSASDALNKYEVIEVNGTSLILSDSLSELTADDVSKRKLWLALKQLFSI
jgi:DNA polymerase III psi subunit